MSWFKNLLYPEKDNRKNVATIGIGNCISSPQPGELWEFVREDKSPWDYDKKPHVVCILDVKCGWVRYRLNEIFDDNRLEVEIFTKIYRKIN